MSTAAQKKAIKDFKNLTSANDKTATELLTAHSWHLERAIDSFYTNRHKYPAASSSSPAAAAKADAAKLSRLFDKYADADEKDSMSGEQLARFFTDVGIEPSSWLTLAFAWQLQCRAFGEIGRREWTAFYTQQGIDSLERMRAQAGTLPATLKDAATFRQFYRWLFDFVKEESDRKSIDAEAALEMWSLVLHSWPLCPAWLAFCQQQKIKVVSSDLWLQLFDFSRDVQADDLRGYDADGAWPVLIDEFVDHIKAKKQSAKA